MKLLFVRKNIILAAIIFLASMSPRFALAQNAYYSFSPDLIVSSGPVSVDGKIVLKIPAIDLQTLLSSVNSDPPVAYWVYFTFSISEKHSDGSWHIIPGSEKTYGQPVKQDTPNVVEITVDRENGVYEYRSNFYFEAETHYDPVGDGYVDGGGASAIRTVTVQKPTKAGKPRNLRVTDKEDQYDGDYKVLWDAPTTGDFDYYLVQERKDQGNWCLNQKGSIHGYCYAQKGTGRSYTATERASGASYSYRLFACNALGCSDVPTSTEVLIVNVQPPPTPDFSWSEPAAGAEVRLGENKTLRIRINNESPGISDSTVHFYRKVGTVTERLNEPVNYDNACNCYNANWTAAPEGAVTLIAEVGNKWGKTASKSIPVTVQANHLPVVSLPALPQTIDQYEVLELQASASDSDGSIAWVKLYVDTEVAHFTATPYQYQWTANDPGQHVIYAEAMDNEGSVARSAEQRVTVEALQPPSSPTQLKINDQLAPIPDNVTGYYTVSWNEVAGATKYQLQQLQVAVDTEFKDIAIPDGVISNYLPNQGQGSYQYRVASCNAAGCGEDFSPVIAVDVVLSAPQAPSEFEIVPQQEGFDFTGTYTLGWKSVTSEPKPKYYRLEEKSGGADSTEDWMALPHNNLGIEFAIEDKAPGRYSYQVKACNAYDCSPAGEIVTVDVLPPTLLTAETACDNQCLLLSGSGMDPDTTFTLIDRETGGQQALSKAAVTWQAPTGDDPTTYAQLPLNSAMQAVLFDQKKKGLHVSAENGNGERAGIDAYGDKTIERLSQISSAPTVGADGTIYVGSGNQVYALNPEDGSVVSGWPYATNDLVKATPVVDSVNGNIYIGSLDDHLYALTQLGLEQWRLKTGGDLVSSAVLDESRILYQGSMDGVLYAVQAQNGAIQWTYPAGAGIAETPVLAGNGTLYFTTVGSSQVYALGRGVLGPDQLAWASSDDSLLADNLEELSWQPGEQHLPEYQTAARLYRLLLQPPLPLSRDVLTFWTYALVNRASVQEVANAFLNSDTGKANFSPTQSNAAFVDALYARAFPGQNQPAFTYSGQTFTRNSLLDAMVGGVSRAQVAALFAQSMEYAAATNELLRRSFDYFYTQDYSWAVFSCDEGDEYTRDCDSDGLPDYWEILFFGSIDTESGGTDADGDGRSNHDAFLANLDPCANLCYYGVTAEAPDPAPMPTLDQGQIDISGTIGSLPGEFRVNESGAATYSIPLSLPAGTAGVAPQFSINYSSQSGNGLLGHGWALGGLSAISRCRQTLGQDGKAKAITWSDEDRFCLDGQRLLALEEGTYGEPGSLYRTEIDSFAVIKAHGGTSGHPDYFTVERKDGSISYHGQGNRSRQRVRVGENTRVFTWAISRFEDSARNNIEFIYTADSGRDEPNHDISHRISEIRYAYTNGGSAGAQVLFDYDDREDHISGYVAGELLQSRKRLSGIRVQNEGESVRRYELEYLDYPADLLSRLLRIRQCAGPAGNLCQPDTVFDWRLPLPDNFAASPRDSVTLSTQRDRAAVGARPADINGDGRMDLIWLEPDWDDDGEVHDQYFKYVLADESGFGPERLAHSDSANVGKTPYRWEMMDYNGDGRADLAFYAKKTNEWRVVLSRPQGNGNWLLGGSYLVADGVSDRDIRFTDVNSDGLADAVSATGYHPLEIDPTQPTTSNRYYHFGEERPLVAEGLESWGDLDPQMQSTERYLDPSAAGDFDGDGSVDLILFDTKITWEWEGFALRLKTQHSRAYQVSIEGDEQSGYKLVSRGKLLDFEQSEDFARTNRNVDASPVERHSDLKQKVHVADINGDGLADLVLQDGLVEELEKDTAKYHYRLSTGLGFKAAVSLDVMSEEAQLQWFDYDSDGHLDLVWHDAKDNRLKVRRWLSLVQKFGGAELVRMTSGAEHTLHLFTDMDGDGVSDYVRIASDKAYLYPATDFRVPVNVIEKIINGLGAETDISYGALSNSGHYARIEITTDTERRCHYEPEVDLEWCGQYQVADAEAFYSALNDTWEADNRLGKLSPTLELMGPMYVVTRVDGSAPTAADLHAKSAISYHYAQAKLQAGGRGLLGFEQLRTVDEQTGVKTTTFYRQDFPFQGYPERTEVKTEDGKLLSQSVNTWKLKNAKGQDWQAGWTLTVKGGKGSSELGPLQPWLAKSVGQTWDLAGGVDDEPLKTVTTENLYDKHGNPEWIKVSTSVAGESFVAETWSQYGTESDTIAFENPDHVMPTYPQLGRLTHTRAEHRRTESGETDRVERISSFDYYRSGREAGLLQWETIEPDQAELRLTTSYTYDDFGNKESATQSAEGEEPRSSTWHYKDDQGRYLEWEKNAHSQITQKIVARDDKGLPTWVKGMAGVSAFFQYDAFGRKVLESSETGAHAITLISAPGSHCPTGSAYQQTVRQAGGGESLTCFDLLAREARSATRGFDGNWVYADTEYDKLGRVARKSEPYSGSPRYWTALDYDILGRVIGTDLPGTVSNNDFTGAGGMPHDVHVDYQGYTTNTTNPEGHTKTETKNAKGELVFVADNIGGQIKYRYDAQGNLRFVTRYEAEGSSGIVTEMRYDKLGRKTWMMDPDKGGWDNKYWEYRYNGFGELNWQKDVKGQVVDNTYDRLGRLVHRIDYRDDSGSAGSIEGDTVWTYNNHPSREDGSPHWEDGVPPGALSGVIDVESGYAQVPGYDRFGRSSATLSSLAEGDDHWTKTTYDQYGRPFQQFDAGGDGTWRSNATENRYNLYGYLEAVVDGENINQASAENFYTVLAMDERGNVTSFRQGNGVVTDRTYDPATGRLEYQTASVLGVNQIQDLAYQWDNLGNLENRRDRSGSKDLFEEFDYDGLSRLRSAQVSGRTAQTIEYDGFGNITHKSDVGDYRYGTQCNQGYGPHAVCETEDESGNIVTYLYDANGNMESDGSDRTLQYSTFDKPLKIEKGGHTTEFKYDPGRSRYLRIDNDSSGKVTETRYIGNVEKITRSDGFKEIKRYLSGGAVVSISTEGGTTARTSRYLHKDHLGSVDVITNASGTVVQAMSFDPWGQRRNAQSWEALIGSELTGFDTGFTTRGYTGHEMLDQVGLIHMNGRIYDARLGRFLQADPFVQSASDLQMYNRYSYVRNNPLVYTDSSGYKIDFWGAVKIIAAVVLTIACEGTCAPEVWAWAMATTSAMQASAQGANGGQIVLAAFTSGVMGYLGGAYGADKVWTGTEAFYFGVAGGITSVLQGGKFGHGFISAYVGAAVNASGVLQGQPGPIQFLGSVVIGGTVSKATGGKFANGAAYAAFAFLVQASSRNLRDNHIGDIDCSPDVCSVKIEGEINDNDLSREHKQNIELINDAREQEMAAAEALANDCTKVDCRSNFEKRMDAKAKVDADIAKAKQDILGLANDKEQAKYKGNANSYKRIGITAPIIDRYGDEIVNGLLKAQGGDAQWEQIRRAQYERIDNMYPLDE